MQPAGYNVGWHLFDNWCKTIKWPFLFPVSKNTTKMCVCVCVCERFDLCWKHTPLQIMDSFRCHPKLNFSKMKVVLCISAELAFKFMLLRGWKIANIKTNVCLVSKSAKMIDYLKFMVDFRSSLIYHLIFSILHVTFKRH